MMQAILQAMFGELTVLGFIALYTYFMLRLGVLEWISLQIYHDPEHLIHLFEDIHFMLFFVMLTFLVQACILIIATLRAEDFFERTEKLLASAPVLEKAVPADAAAAPAVSQMLATYKAARSHCCTRICICPRMLWGYREAEAKEELTYSLIRARFIFPPRPEPGKTPLPVDFAFSTYLRHRMVHEVAHCLHVSPATWFARSSSSSRSSCTSRSSSTTTRTTTSPCTTSSASAGFSGSRLLDPREARPHPVHADAAPPPAGGTAQGLRRGGAHRGAARSEDRGAALRIARAHARRRPSTSASSGAGATGRATCSS